MTSIFYGTSKELRFVPSNTKAWLDFLMANESKQLVMEIDVVKSKRTLSQNDFYWFYLGIIEKETGNLATDMHELFKRKLLPPIPKKVLGVEFKIPATTTTLTKSEFSDYLDKICAMTNVPIPVIEEAKKPEYPTNNLNPSF